MTFPSAKHNLANEIELGFRGDPFNFFSQRPETNRPFGRETFGGNVATKAKAGPWTSNGRWVSHSIGSFQEEWTEWVEVAALSGKSTNGFIRQALNEWCRYERIQLAEKA